MNLRLRVKPRPEPARPHVDALAWLGCLADVITPGLESREELYEQPVDLRQLLLLAPMASLWEQGLLPQARYGLFHFQRAKAMPVWTVIANHARILRL
jgi:hypothetical protein